MKSLVFTWFLLGLYGMSVGLIREYFYSSTSVPLNKAEIYCRQRCGYLASITTEEEQQMATKATGGQKNPLAWIGLNRTTPHVNSWKWTDGTNVNFTKWNANEPDDRSPGEECVVMGESTWYDTTCGGQFNTVCSRRLVLVREKKTWDEALRHCRHRYINLVYLDSVSQLDPIKTESQQAQTTSVWTGLRFVDKNWLSVNGMRLGSLVSLPTCPVWPYRCGAYNINTNVWENRNCSEAQNFLCYY